MPRITLNQDFYNCHARYYLPFFFSQRTYAVPWGLGSIAKGKVLASTALRPAAPHNRTCEIHNGYRIAHHSHFSRDTYVPNDQGTVL